MIQNNIPHSKNRQSFTDLLVAYYHLESPKELSKCLMEDFVASVFFGSGSGLPISFFKGLFFKLFLNYKIPALIGKSFKIVNFSKVKIGRNFWAKDNVTFFAGGKLTVGDGCVFCDRSSVWSGIEGVRIGSNFSLGIGGYICGTEGEIKIGNSVIMADNVRLYSWNHKFTKNSKNYASLSTSHKRIIIGNNCWIGSGVVILDGVKLGDNCVVGAGSVVNRSFPNNSFIVGVPGKKIKSI